MFHVNNNLERKPGFSVNRPANLRMESGLWSSCSVASLRSPQKGLLDAIND